MTAPGTAPARPVMLRDIDLAAFTVALAMRLRQAGVVVGLTAIESFTRGMAACPPTSLPTLYWVGRTTLVQRWADLGTFDAVFGAVFSEPALPLDPNARRRSTDPAGGEDDRWAPLPAAGSAGRSGRRFALGHHPAGGEPRAPRRRDHPAGTRAAPEHSGGRGDDAVRVVGAGAPYLARRMADQRAAELAVPAVAARGPP